MLVALPLSFSGSERWCGSWHHAVEAYTYWTFEMRDFFMLPTLSGLTRCAIIHVAFGQVRRKIARLQTGPRLLLRNTHPFRRFQCDFQAFVLINWLR